MKTSSVALHNLSKWLVRHIPFAALLIVLTVTATLLASCSGESPEPTTETEPGDTGVTTSTETDDAPGAVSKDEPLAYAQALVQQAIDRYSRDGREETIAFYNSEESLDGEWHVFILDEEGYIASMAAFPDWVGVHDSEFKGHNHYPAGQMVIDGAREEGLRIGYLASDFFGRIELKHLWVVKHDGLIFGSSSWSG